MRQKGIVIKSIHGLIYFGKEKLSFSEVKGRERGWVVVSDERFWASLCKVASILSLQWDHFIDIFLSVKWQKIKKLLGLIEDRLNNVYEY